MSSSTARERDSLVVTAASLSGVDGGSPSLLEPGLEVSGSVSEPGPGSGAGSGVPA